MRSRRPSMALLPLGLAEETLSPGLTDLPPRREDTVEVRRALMHAAHREKPFKSRARNFRRFANLASQLVGQTKRSVERGTEDDSHALPSLVGSSRSAGTGGGTSARVRASARARLAERRHRSEPVGTS